VRASAYRELRRRGLVTPSGRFGKRVSDRPLVAVRRYAGGEIVEIRNCRIPT
jgi:hypothetical protein